jgi:hypothetical protein
LQDKEITQDEAINFIKNTLNYLVSTCKDNNCKNTISSKLTSVNSFSVDKYKNVTRYDFFELLNNYLPVSDYNGSDNMIFRDLDESKQKLAKNIFKTKTWKDNY